MKRALLIWAAMACMAVNSVPAQEAAVNKIIEIGQTDNQVMDHLDVLTNRIGGRVIGSNAYDNAVDWVASKFKEWGLEVELQEAGTLPVGFNRGPWFGKLLGENGMELHFVTPSYTAGTKGVQRGHVVQEPLTQSEFDRIKGQLKGAWVLINGKNVGWPVDRSAKGDSIRAAIIAENNEVAKKNRQIMEDNWRNNTNTPLLPMKEDVPALFYKEMCEAGALGFIQSASVPLRALYDKAVMHDPTFTFDNLPTVCDIKLDEHQYATIKQMVKERRTFFLEFDIRNHFRMGPVKYHNVIGKIKGTKYPNEYVMASGHLDAFDVATGGVDCGSGVTPVMEAARMIMKSGAKPKRTMLFCAFAGEEFGLLGSTAWVKANKDAGYMDAKYGNSEYWFGGSSYYVNFNIQLAKRRSNDPDGVVPADDKEAEAYLLSMVQEGIELILATEYPTAGAQVSGVDCFYVISAKVYNGLETFTYTYTFKGLGNAKFELQGEPEVTK